MEQTIQGRAAIVTGAGNGLGLAIARRFGASGSRVVLVDRDPIVASRLGQDGLPKGQCFSIVQDLARNEAAQVVLSRALEMMGRVDTLINNAAWSMHSPLLETTNEDFDQLEGRALWRRLLPLIRFEYRGLSADDGQPFSVGNRPATAERSAIPAILAMIV
jgi:NAD(P)-dependent dehydrogenase (short-subunit alcohol dehydrogenase family)